MVRSRFDAGIAGGIVAIAAALELGDLRVRANRTGPERTVLVALGSDQHGRRHVMLDPLLERGDRGGSRSGRRRALAGGRSDPPLAA